MEIFWQGFEYNSDLVKVNYISLVLTLQHATKNYFDFSSVSVCNSKKLFFMVNNFVNLIKTLKLFEYWKKDTISVESIKTATDELSWLLNMTVTATIFKLSMHWT